MSCRRCRVSTRTPVHEGMSILANEGFGCKKRGYGHA